MTKEEYKIYAEDLIKDISNRIDELRQRANGVDEKKRIHFEEQVNRLVVLRDELNQKIAQFDEVSENRWEEVKSDFKKAVEYLKDGFESLFSILSE